MSQSEYFSVSEEEWERDSSSGADDDMTKMLVGLKLYQFC